MKLLLDQNLPRSLARFLHQHFPDSRHELDLNLDTAADEHIFSFARENGYTVLSKDSDFRQLSFIY